MSFVEFVRGAGTVLFIVAIAGGVAYVGDRVGHQVGRKRLTLFGIRPRYTSTIVAIGTGMVIALVVTVGAILASQQVKTAFFKLSTINQQIAQLQSRERALEQKVNTGRLVVPTDSLMVPYLRAVSQSESAAERLATIKKYYFLSVQYINATYHPYGLGIYTPPKDIEKRLEEFSNAATMHAQLAGSNVLLSISSDQNLFVKDPIHFQMTATPDTRRFIKGQQVAQLNIPGNSGANATVAISQLQTQISNAGRLAHLPSYLANFVYVQQIFPSLAQMQSMLAKPGIYLLTAYAAQDVYPHTGGIPVVIALAQQK